MKIEKREGADWVVSVQVPDEEEPIEVSVFGVETESEAVREAFASFGVTPEQPGVYQVVRVEKDEEET